MNKPELLAPAGDFERLQMAVEYGADAVYLGGKLFTMRAAPSNFGPQELKRAVEYAHSRGVKVYLTLNTLPRSDELAALPEAICQAAESKVDAFIISDLGVLQMARTHAPGVEIHISTQAGVVNFAAANAFYAMGAKRVVLARELSLAEITLMRRNSPSGLDIEAFVHGAMCVSFSGRCLLSSYLTGRDANRGDCAQPCRWSYALMEKKRQGVYMPVYEDESSTTILNARDLCMIEYIPELISAGVTSFKIEGRAKSAYYVAAVTNAYRIAIDRYFEGGNSSYGDLLEEVKKVSHRDYCTGFYFGPIQNGQIYSNQSYTRAWDIAAVVEKFEGGTATLSQRNTFAAGEELELLEPGKAGVPIRIGPMFDRDGQPIERASHPEMKVLMPLDRPVKPFSILRKRAED